MDLKHKSQLTSTQPQPIPHTTWTTSSNNSNLTAVSEDNDVMIIEEHVQPHQTSVPSLTQSNKRRKQRQSKYREAHREILRKRNQIYYSQKHPKISPIAPEVVNVRAERRTILRQDRNRRYRALHREEINERQHRYRVRIKENQLIQVGIDQELQFIETAADEGECDVNVALPCSTYSLDVDDEVAHNLFIENFRNNQFGHACSVCDRLCFEKDLQEASPLHEHILQKITNVPDVTAARICPTCKLSLDSDEIPPLSVHNGFQYPMIPPHLPKLDFLIERLISPCIPFIQIRRLWQNPCRAGIYGQIINAPGTIATMAKSLPRTINDELCIYVHIKKKMILNSNVVRGLGNSSSMKMWLDYLINTPLYQHYKIEVNELFYNEEMPVISMHTVNDMCEKVNIGAVHVSQQETLLWNENDLKLASEHNPQASVCENHAEELSFPGIYVGQCRTLIDNVKVTPSMMISSELMRKDRRGVSPHHLLYMAMKVMRQRFRDYLEINSKYLGDTKITVDRIKSEEATDNLLASSSGFLKSVPNSSWYCAERKKDLLAMLCQLGRPTAVMKLSSNEMGWPDLLNLISQLTQGCEETPKFSPSELTVIQKYSLINRDLVTCAVYFNRMVEVLMTILQSKECSPFGKYRVNNYYKQIAFCGVTTHAHILLWLDNAPQDLFAEDQKEAVTMIDSLISVSTSEASGHINLQIHKHNVTCCERVTDKKCRFQVPSMPIKCTMILTPMDKNSPSYKLFSTRYHEIRANLERMDYNNMEDYYLQNNIRSDEEYRCILSAGIESMTIFYKRKPSEKWHQAFNPFVLNVLNSNMNLHIITDEYSCAEYIVKYVDKRTNEMSHLQKNIVRVMKESPEFDIREVTRKMSIDISNSTEITSQEAAWYLLGQPISEASIEVRYIDTRWPNERQRIQKIQGLSCFGGDSEDIWEEDWYDKYQRRSEQLEHISLAQFVSRYQHNDEYVENSQKHVIRYRNYDSNLQYNEYRREMVTLHLPFRAEESEIMADRRFMTVYEDNEEVIFQRRTEFESDLDVRKVSAMCREVPRENGNVSLAL